MSAFKKSICFGLFRGKFCQKPRNSIFLRVRMKACHIKTRSFIGAAVVIAVIILFAANQRSKDSLANNHKETHVWRGRGGGTSFLTQTGEDEDDRVHSLAIGKERTLPTPPPQPPPQSEFTHIPCRINEVVSANVGYKDDPVRHVTVTKPVKCMSSQVEQETYIPFTFIEKYFGIIGEPKTSKNGSSFFEWSHSQSKVFPHLKDERYTFHGVFMQFANFNVESRARVKCITAMDGVPISTQWDKNGYYYSTQIAQYSLSHWSKNLLHSPKPPSMLEDGDQVEGDWRGDITRVTSDKCVHFDLSSPISLDLTQNLGTPAFVLHFDLQYKQNITVSVSIKSPTKAYVVKYVADDTYIRRQENEIIFGYGNDMSEGEWKPFTRHLLQDLQKAMPKNAYLAFAKNVSSIRVTRLQLHGVGCITNVSLGTSEHMRMFISGADWLIRNQDTAGGWPMQILFNKDSSKYPGAGELDEGWYGAMAQGHAMSVLTRAWLTTSDAKYSDAAVRAMNIFSMPSQEGGIVAKFLDTLKWYEEYPTTPGSFVLNGFMYSLVGLHDIMEMLQEMGERPEELELATQLWRDGMKSLLTLLPLFDTGSGTVYDLRHFSMKGSAPKLARWDYHATHINQLYLLSTVAETAADTELILATAERWRSYMTGDRAEHN